MWKSGDYPEGGGDRYAPAMTSLGPDDRLGLPDPDELFRTLVEQVPALVYVASHHVSNPRMLYVSPQVIELLGYPPEAFTGDASFWPRTLHSDDRDRVMREWADAVRTGRPFASEYREQHADGRMLWMRDLARIVRDDDGDPLYWHGVQQDITESKRIELELQQSEERYRRLVEQMPAVVYLDTHSQRPETLYFSPNVEEILGLPSVKDADGTIRWNGIVHPDDRARVDATWDAAFTASEPFHCEFRYIRPDGSTVWVRDSMVPIRDETGEIVAWQGLMLDVTAQREMEEQVHRSEAQFRSLVENLPSIIYRTDRDDERRSLYVSPHIVNVLGYSREEWLDQPDIWTELLHPEDREHVLAAYDQHNESGEPWHLEYRMIANDGQTVWVRDQAILVRDEQGAPMFWQGVMLDINQRKELEERLVLMNDELELRVLERTAELEDVNEMMSLEIGERRRMETELREAQARYRRLVEDLPGMVYSWYPRLEEPALEGEPPRAPYISPKIEEILGYTPAEWGDQLWKDRLHPHDRERVLALVEHSERTGESLRAEYRFLAKDGHIVWVLDHATLHARDLRGHPEVFHGVMLDITARKQAEEKAADVEARYRMLAEEGPIVPYIYELDHATDPPTLRLEYVSPRTADVMGYPGSSWVENPLQWYEAMHPDDRGPAREEAERIRRTGEPWAYDYRMIAADGRVIWLHDTGRMVSRDELGRPTRFQGVVLDITERKEEEESLRRGERDLRSMVERLPVIPWTEVDDPETGRSHITYIGPQVEQAYGYTPEELTAWPSHFEQMLHPDDRDRVMRTTLRTMRSGEPWEDRFRVVARDGTIRHVHCIARRTSDGPDDPGTWYGVTVVLDEAPGLSPEDGARARAPEGTDAASRAGRRSRRPADGSRATR